MPKIVDYGKGTRVGMERSLSNIKTMLADKNVGARNIQAGRNDDIGVDFFSFVVGATLFRYIIPLPRRDDERVIYKREQYGAHNRIKVDRAEAERRYSQLVAEIWRAVELNIKAALVSAAKGLESIEEVLAADIVTSNGMTVREMVRQQVEARRSGDPALPIALPTLALPPPSGE